MAQGIVFLSPMQQTWIEFPAPSFGMANLCGHVGSETADENTFSVYLSVSFLFLK